MSWLGKIEECENCGEKLSVKQKYCPRCRSFNLDYQKRNWAAEMGMSFEKNEKNEEE